MTWAWYITIAAIRQYMEMAGLGGELEDDNPDFRAAQDALGELSLTAQPARTPPAHSGALTYRAKVTLRGRRTRIELTVAPAGREEGALPQLVRVRDKGP